MRRMDISWSGQKPQLSRIALFFVSESKFCMFVISYSITSCENEVCLRIIFLVWSIPLSLNGVMHLIHPMKALNAA
jgi:hypothetical protein